MTLNEQATLVFSKYKHNNSSNCLCRVTSVEAGALLQLLLNDWVWKSPWALNSIYGTLLSASHFSHYLLDSNFRFSTKQGDKMFLFYFLNILSSFILQHFSIQKLQDRAVEPANSPVKANLELMSQKYIFHRIPHNTKHSLGAGDVFSTGSSQ